MSLKKNILANYISQIYVTIIGIVMVPQFIHYMGAEAYGLVGFFSMLQAWFQLLDMGLTPTMSRETARFRGGAVDALSLRRLLRALEGIFVSVAILGAVTMVAGAGTIAGSWLKVQQLSFVEVQQAIMLMALIIALRWVCGLYRGLVSGFENLTWLGGFNIVVTTARFVLIIPFFIYLGTSPTVFFGYQLTIAVIETVVLVFQAYRLMPKNKMERSTPWKWEPIRGQLKFSLIIAFTSSTWVLVTQTDKLILSKLLQLTDYAYFTISVLIASGISIVSGPISSALLPRLTKLHAENNEIGLISLYRSATQLVAIIAIPATFVLAVFAEKVLWVWTGDAVITMKAAPVLTLYALGNGILAIGAFPYYLQFAKGDLNLHLIGSALFVCFLLPFLFVATWKYGMIGPGYAWLGTHLVFFIFWLPIVHRHLSKGLHYKWLFLDLGPIFIISSLVICAIRIWSVWPNQRFSVGVRITEVSLMLLVVSAFGSSWIREAIRVRWRARFAK